jgi:hypothetical protein
MEIAPPRCLTLSPNNKSYSIHWTGNRCGGESSHDRQNADNRRQVPGMTGGMHSTFLWLALFAPDFKKRANYERAIPALDLVSTENR